jgi:predicted ATPase
VHELSARSRIGARTIEYLEGGRTQAPRQATLRQLAGGLALTGHARRHFLEGPYTEQPVDTPPRHNLPHPLSSFIARTQEMRDLERLLRGTTRRRLITLSGPGGIGKTRLALAAAAAMLGQFPGGVYLLDLAPLEPTSWLEFSLASVLEVRVDNPAYLGEMLVARLREQRTLLIFDNCEHLREPVGALIGRLLGNAPSLQIIATSREPLGLSGELVRRIPALALPPLAAPAAPASAQLAAIAASEAAQFFIVRANLVAPGFTLTAANAVPVAAICRRLDGLPLAIELAASQLVELPVATLAAELDRALHAGGARRRGGPDRQRTMRATLDWSYALLSRDERALLRRLAIFAGGWTAAAAAVCDDDDRPATAQVLAALVAKSLVNREAGHDDGAETAVGADRADNYRYQLPETVRQYARDRLREADEEAPLERRFCDWAIGVLESVATPLDGGPEGAAWLDLIATELTNLRAAREWALAHDPQRALRLISATWPYAFARLGHDTGRYLLRRALEVAPGPSPWRVAALHGLGFLTLFENIPAGRAYLTEALALAEATGDQARLAALRWQLAFACITGGDIAAAEGHLALGWPAIEAAAHPGRRSPYRIVRGFIAAARGEFDRAEDELTRAEADVTSADQPLFRCIILARFGAIQLRRGNLTAAEGCFTTLGTLAASLGSWFYRFLGRSGLGQVREWAGEYATAALDYADALAISIESGGSNLERAMILLGQGRVALRQGEPALALAHLEACDTLVTQLAHDALRRELAAPYGFALWHAKQFARAAAQFDDALTRNHPGDPSTLARTLDGLACLAFATGAAVPAARWLASAAALREEAGLRVRPAEAAVIAAAHAAHARHPGNATTPILAPPLPLAEAIASARAWLAQIRDASPAIAAD